METYHQTIPKSSNQENCGWVMENGKYSVDWLKGDLHPTPPVVNIITDDESENQSQTVEASDVDGEETPSQRL